MNYIPRFEEPKNAQLVHFATSEEKIRLRQTINQFRSTPETFFGCDPVVLPLWIDGKQVFPAQDAELGTCHAPHNNSRIFAHYIKAQKNQVDDAIKAALAARETWARIAWQDRLEIFRNAATLLDTKYFYAAMAIVMEDYSKTPWEAMIDIKELVDFWRASAYEALNIYRNQPISNEFERNYAIYRPLNGFVFALPPNNFISIGLNLPSAPLAMGNVEVCKPSKDTVASFHFMLKILHEAGLPPDVLSVIQGDSAMIGDIVMSHPDMAKVHFTGSVDVMHDLYEAMGSRIRSYKNFPKIIGEAGGKDFLIVYDDANPQTTVSGIIKSAFGYQGRKCSALSRMYITHKKWAELLPLIKKELARIKVGDVADFRNFMGSIINRSEWEKIMGQIAWAKGAWSTIDVIGGEYSSEGGWWIHPTIIVTRDPIAWTMTHEIFGPILTVYPMENDDFEQNVLGLCASAANFALTGAVSTTDHRTFEKARDYLLAANAAGNFYNWGTTGASVFRQWFGGSGWSGSNSKSGTEQNMREWIDIASVCEFRNPPPDFMPAYVVE